MCPFLKKPNQTLTPSFPLRPYSAGGSFSGLWRGKTFLKSEVHLRVSTLMQKKNGTDASKNCLESEESGGFHYDAYCGCYNVMDNVMTKITLFQNNTWCNVIENVTTPTVC